MPDLDTAITTIAPFYDLDFGALAADIEMYRQFAAVAQGRRKRAAVLELGAGTGRVAAALAEAGHTVVAVEANAAMRVAAADQLTAAGVELVAADFRTLRLRRSFDLVICALSTFCHLQSRADQRATLAAVRRHLAPGGLAIFDLPPFDAGDWEPGPRPPLLEWVRLDPRSGRWLCKWATLEADPASQTQWVTYLYDEQADDGGVRRSIARFPLRHVFRFEMEGLLEAARLSPVQMYGSYDLDPVEAGQRLIVVAHAAGGGRRRRSA